MKNVRTALTLFLLSSFINGHAEISIDQKPLLSYVFNDDNYNALEKELAQLGIEVQYCTKSERELSKDWTVLVYIAADNDLRTFVRHNIKQMTQVGSNKNINILVHLDVKLQGNNKITRRYLIKKDKVVLLSETSHGSYMDSGNPETLISFFKTAAQQYPAENYALILWNHGTGVIDPGRGKIINPSILFNFNPKSQKLELDRSIGFLDLVELLYQERGVCWDNTTGNYLTNKKLEYALSEIYKINGNKKLSIIGFDACLMSMLEIGAFVKNYAEYMVGSQEVELGQGWNYATTLEPFNHGPIEKKQFAKQIVQAYKQSYQRITNDYTLSAINLELISTLEEKVHHIGQLLLNALAYQKNNSVKNMLLLCRSKKLCAHFDEPSYIDLHNLFSNMLKYLDQIQLSSNGHLKSELRNTLQQSIAIIEQAVFENVAGKSQLGANGISIYFPERRLHPSYASSQFAQNNAWSKVVLDVLKP